MTIAIEIARATSNLIIFITIKIILQDKLLN